MNGRLLGVDYGERRVGLAICDAGHLIASPLETYERRGPRAQDGSGTLGRGSGTDTDAEWFRTLVREEEVTGLVVGLPMHTDGREGVKAAEARAFGAWLGEVTGLPVVFEDERFTTVQAESALWEAGLSHKRRRARRDRVAAQILLQAYLDSEGERGA